VGFAGDDDIQRGVFGLLMQSMLMGIIFNQTETTRVNKKQERNRVSALTFIWFVLDQAANLIIIQSPILHSIMC
jgi:hypothetical protein